MHSLCVQLDSGVIEGNVLATSRAFLGIPFAAPPVGSLRWQAPQTVQVSGSVSGVRQPVMAHCWVSPAFQSWSGIRPAKQYGNACYQPDNQFVTNNPVRQVLWIAACNAGFVKRLALSGPPAQISEDCLYLNVYTPYPLPAKPVPIMIFIYGENCTQASDRALSCS